MPTRVCAQDERPNRRRIISTLCAERARRKEGDVTEEGEEGKVTEEGEKADC